MQSLQEEVHTLYVCSESSNKFVTSSLMSFDGDSRYQLYLAKLPSLTLHCDADDIVDRWRRNLFPGRESGQSQVMFVLLYQTHTVKTSIAFGNGSSILNLL